MTYSCIKVVSFFGVVQRIYSLFSSSPKRWKILLDNVLGLTLKSLSNTRWESQIKSVKAIRFQGPLLRLALVELYKSCDDAKLKSEVESLVNTIESLEFLLGMISYFKKLQSKSICIDTTIKKIESVLLYFEKYRNEGFTSSMNVAKSVALEMNVEPTFPTKQHSQLFLVVVDMTIISLKSRFEQLKSFDNIFGFLFDSKKLKSLEDNNLRKYCAHVHSTFSHDNLTDMTLPDNLMTSIKILEFHQLKGVFKAETSKNLFEIINVTKKVMSEVTTMLMMKHNIGVD
ncbi:hypothetical protein GmHk_19G054985 [Glycine max]|nr:hypothetical protein GmHk_19G054985 [Glycine max]